MHILIAIDLSPGSERLLSAAVRLLDGVLESVHLLHVVQPDPDFVGFEVDTQVMRDRTAHLFHRERQQLQTMAEALRARGVEAHALAIQGATAATILRQAEKLNVDLIVVGAHGHGLLYRLLQGDASEQVLRASSRPVLAIPLDEV